MFYTALALYLIPARAITYKQKALHYFLFDLCYYTNVLNLVFLWFAPHSPTLFVACYCLNHGSLASAVITWRNSLVFHDWDKVIHSIRGPSIPANMLVSRSHLFSSTSILHSSSRSFGQSALSY